MQEEKTLCGIRSVFSELDDFWTGALIFIPKSVHKIRGGEWYLKKCGSGKILAGSWNLGSVFDKSRKSRFCMVCFYFFWVLPKSLGLGFLTRISASQILPFAPPPKISLTRCRYTQVNNGYRERWDACCTWLNFIL